MNEITLNLQLDPIHYTLYALERRVSPLEASIYSAAVTLADVQKTLQNGRESEIERITAFIQDHAATSQGNDVLAVYTQWQGHEIILVVRDHQGELTAVCRVNGKDSTGGLTRISGQYQFKFSV